MRNLYFLLVLLFFASCQSDECETIDCGNGICNEDTGECDCEQDWGGEFCDSLLVQIDSTNNDTTIVDTLATDQLIAAFDIQNNSCFAPCTVTVVNNSSNADTYQWNFGDATTTSSLAAPEHIYNTPGNFVLQLIVSNDQEQDTLMEIVTIQSVCDTLNLNCGDNGNCNFLTGECDCDAGWTGDNCDEEIVDLSTAVADFSAQVDADNSLAYDFANNSVVNGITDNSFTSSWDFGGDGTSTEANPIHIFSAEGTYEVTLTVTASDGVVSSTTETIEVTGVTNRYASITDMMDDDTGELRLNLDSIQVGRVTFMYRVAEGPIDMDIQDGFISVLGNSTSGDFALVEVRLKDNAPHEFREGASDATIAAANFPEGMPNVWVPIEISWAADGTNYPTYTVVIDGQTAITDAVSTTNGGPNDEAPHLAAVKNGVQNFQWKYASNSAVSDGVYHVDDIVIYSSDSGFETVVFEDDFQARVAGENLNPNLNSNSPYHPNSSDATVGEDD